MARARPRFIVVALALLLALLPAAASAGLPPEREFTPPQVWLPFVLPGAGGVHGRVTSWPGAWPDEPVGVWLASYWPLTDDGLSGVWVLEPSTMPWHPLPTDGSFTFDQVAPGRYCIIVGITPLHLAPVRNEWGLATVFSVEAGSTLDVGDLEVW